jgi:hypothetical protein
MMMKARTKSGRWSIGVQRRKRIPPMSQPASGKKAEAPASSDLPRGGEIVRKFIAPTILR